MSCTAWKELVRLASVSAKPLFAVALMCGHPAASAQSQPATGPLFFVSFELPRLSVAEYHEPYVAIWIADGSSEVRANLAVWYMHEDGPEGEGTTWLKDLRQWWRRSGRTLSLPVDGLTSATRSPGSYRIEFDGAEPPLSDLDPGSYDLVVEAVREVGDREILRIPFDWGFREAVNLSAQGSSEIGRVDLKIASGEEVR